jgi:hypothetical protein
MDWECGGGVQFRMRVVDADILGVGLSDCNQAIFFDGCRQHSVSLVVNVFSDEIDPSWGASDELRSGSIVLLERIQDALVARRGVTGV